MGQVIKRGVMTKLIDGLEMSVLKTPVNQSKSAVDGEDLLILIEYARQLEAVILMMDDDPKRARELFKY